MVSDPRIVLAPHDLTRGLPQGSIHLQAQILSSMSAEAIRQQLGLPATAAIILAEAVPRRRHRALLTPRPESQPSVAIGPASGTRPVSREEDKTASLRINVELLDRLMTLIGELTLIRNQSLLACDQDDSPLRPIVQRLSTVTSALQETVLRTRMQPVGNLFGKFPRVVRDLGTAARKTGRGDDRRPGGRARQDDPRTTGGSAHPSGPQQCRPRHRDARRTRRQRQAPDRTDHAHGIARRRPGSHRDSR